MAADVVDFALVRLNQKTVSMIEDVKEMLETNYENLLSVDISVLDSDKIIQAVRIMLRYKIALAFHKEHVSDAIAERGRGRAALSDDEIYEIIRKVDPGVLEVRMI